MTDLFKLRIQHTLVSRVLRIMLACTATAAFTGSVADAQQPDLVATTLGGLGSQRAGDSTVIAVTVMNRSTVAVTTTWYVQVVLSTDTSVSGADLVLGGTSGGTLGAGATQTLTVRVFIPQKAVGPYYVIAQADAGRQVQEANENNNSIASPVPVPILAARPDLIVASVRAPAGAATGASTAFTATVRNVGTLDATSGWNLRLHLSIDTVFTAADSAIGSLGVATVLRPGDSATVTGQLTVLPTVPQGAYYLFAVADWTAQVAELNETNNVARAPTATNVYGTVDLLPKAVCCATVAYIGRPVVLSATVTNSGAATAPTGWTVRWYLSVFTLHLLPFDVRVLTRVLTPSSWSPRDR